MRPVDDRQIDPDIIDSLYRRYAGDIRRFIGRYGLPFDVAQDLAQEVFIRCYSHLDLGRPEAHRAFLYKIAQNLVIDWVRRKGRERKRFEEEPQHGFSAAWSAEPIVLPREGSTDLEQAMARLLPRLRNVFVLYELEGFTLKEIAKFHEVGTSTVKRDLDHARRKLRSLLTGAGRKPNVAA